MKKLILSILFFTSISFAQAPVDVRIGAPTGYCNPGNIAFDTTASRLYVCDKTHAWVTTLMTDALVNFTDVATGNASTTAHGYLPKLDNVVTHFLNGQGGWTVPPKPTVTNCGAVAACAGTVVTAPKISFGHAALVDGILTLTALPFTAIDSYACNFNRTVPTATSVAYVSAASVTFTSATLTDTDVVTYTCTGN